MFTAQGWKYYYQRYLGWFPIQFCMVCSKPYWGGFPTWGVRFTRRNETYANRLVQTWQASWREYCSMKCCQEDNEECWKHYN